MGFAGYVVDVVTTSALQDALNVYLARVPAFMAAVTTTWVLNRSFTFKNRSVAHSSRTREYLHYLSLMLVGLAANYAAYAVTITLIPDTFYPIPISVAVGSITGMIFNFQTARKYIYK